MNSSIGCSSVDNPPDPSRIVEGLRDTGYDFNTAVADIIDNSIAADASTIYVSVVADPHLNVTVAIADDGCGMDYDGLLNAMKYGSDSRKDPNSLGKFGLGLKTASTAFCRKLSVISRPSVGAETRKVCWDLDNIAAKGSWELLIEEPSEEDIELLDQAAQGGSGTLVLWEKVDRLFQRTYSNDSGAKRSLKSHIKKLRDHIALTYQRFLDHEDPRARNIDIYLDDESVEPFDPFCLDEEHTDCLATQRFEISDSEGNDEAGMLLNAYVIPRRDEFSSPEKAEKARLSNDTQGFYVYRENRLIHSGDWMGMFKIEPHLSLLRVELSFDHKADKWLQIDIKKSRILLNDEVATAIEKRILPAPRREAEKRYRDGTASRVAKTPADTHRPADKTIDEKAPVAEKSKVIEVDKAREQATIENKYGTHKVSIKIREKGDDGMVRIIPVDELEDGLLWNPTIVDEKKAVAINKTHAFYQKIYYPLLNNTTAVKGMDFLLWALAEGELSSYSDEAKAFFSNLKYDASRAIANLVADLPEPDVDAIDSSDETDEN